MRSHFSQEHKIVCHPNMFLVFPLQYLYNFRHGTYRKTSRCFINAFIQQQQQWLQRFYSTQSTNTQTLTPVVPMFLPHLREYILEYIKSHMCCVLRNPLYAIHTPFNVSYMGLKFEYFAHCSEILIVCILMTA